MTRLVSIKSPDPNPNRENNIVNISAKIGLLVLLVGCTLADSEASEKDFNLSSNIDALLSEASSDGSGFAVIVEFDGQIILSKGYGYADREQHVAFTPASIAQIGSLTKQFNAAAILQLVENDEVDLAAPLRKYIPGVAPPVGEITLHQLLTHSSGLPEYCGDDFDPMGRDEFVDVCLGLPLVFEPGTEVAYSNVGYSAIAAVIEFVTGLDFDTYLKQKVLLLNGLKKTGHQFPKNLEADFVRGYLEDQDMGNIAASIEALDGDWWNLKGNGGMQASTQDMYTWYKVLNGGGALSPYVRGELTTPHAPWSDGVAEGYGWYFRSDDGGRVRQMSHSGSDGVFFSYYWHRPDKQAFMYFVGSSGEEPTKKVLREILGTFNAMFDGPQ